MFKMVTNTTYLIGFFSLFLRNFFFDLSNIFKLLSQTLLQFFPYYSLSEPIENEGKKAIMSEEEVKMVMNKLGIDVTNGEERSLVGEEEVLKLFDEEEPSLEELKEAFDVFDENKDGFIDAVELQSVLCSLGLLKELGTNKCQRMIEVVDENEDGLVDFLEFVRFMENCFF
ncbi:hypothetical protein UlMin_041170 [Ulmus minor]